MYRTVPLSVRSLRGLFAEATNSTTSPILVLVQLPQNPGRRVLPVRSCCIAPCFSARFLAMRVSRASRRASTSLRTSAMARCSGRGGMGMEKRFNQLYSMLSTVVPDFMHVARILTALAAMTCSRYSPSTNGAGVTALISWLIATGVVLRATGRNLRRIPLRVTMSIDPSGINDVLDSRTASRVIMLVVWARWPVLTSLDDAHGIVPSAQYAGLAIDGVAPPFHSPISPSCLISQSAGIIPTSVALSSEDV